MTTKNIIQAIHDTMWDEMQRDESIIVLGEDVAGKGGVFKATEGFRDAFGELRVIDTPLAELGIIGVAIGAAVNGLRPIAEIQFADFIHPAFDQIVNEAAKFYYRSNGEWNVPLVIRTPYGGGIHGGLYHSQSVEAFFAHVPGLKVVTPSTPYDAAGLLRAAIRDPDPVLYLEHKKTYRLIQGEVPDEPYEIPIGLAEIKRAGTDLTVFAYGMMLHHTLEAATAVVDEGIDVEVVDLRTLHPLDKQTILESAKKTGKVLIVHEDTRTMGLGAEVAALIADEAFEWLDGPIHRVTGPDIPAMPYAKPMEDFFLPNPEKIAAGIRELAAY
ncbi:MAG: alpha-ketoacid dehydrogenase subunit beta [Anaerolineae bacterium]